jgi:gliding motility-associated protein GldM
MAGGKQTPRQRMIGILYLVLLGLIALDVPDNLLDSFKHISDSLSASKANVQTGISNAFADFEQTTLKQPTDMINHIYARAKKARELSESLDKYIDSLKKIMVAETGGMSESTGDYEGRENLDESVNLMVQSRKNAFVLHKKIDETRQALLNLLDPKERAGANLALDATAPPHRKGFPDKSWEEANFGEGIPMGAAMTALVKIQADTKNAENEVVSKILVEANKSPVHLDKYAAVAVAPSSYLLVGQQYTAQVFLTAYDSHANPSITVDGSPVPVEDGKGIYTASTGTAGIKTWTGTIKVQQTDGTTKTYTTVPQTYQVAPPSAVVSPDKMNVLYTGVENPVSISAPGIPKEKLNVTIDNGTLSGSAGKYMVKVNSLGTATVKVSGELAPGKLSVLGSTLFRVKRIPDPKAAFGGKSGGTMSATNIRGQSYLNAVLEGFEFDAKFNVTHFTLLVIKPRQDAIIKTGNGSELTSEMKATLATVVPGSTIIFRDIIAVGPDGTQRGLDPIVLNAN